MTEKIDLVKEMKHLYAPSAKAPVLVDVPSMNFLMIDGHGDPNNNPSYMAAVEALYTLAYTLKFAIKKAEGIDFAVLPSEGLWWAENMANFSIEDKSNWEWTMMIGQPDFVTVEWVENARAAAKRKKSLPELDRIRYQVYHEGPSAQILHLGPYAAEGPTVARLHAFIKEQGFERLGKHHEIYLSDPNRSAPEKMRTIIRQPVQKV